MEFSWAISNSKIWCCECATPPYDSKFGRLSCAWGLENLSFHSNTKERQSKECSNYHLMTTSHTPGKYSSKFPKPGFNRMWTMSFQMLKLNLERAEAPKIKLPTRVWSLINKGDTREESTSIWPCQGLWLCGSQQNMGNYSRDRTTRPFYMPPEKSVCNSRSNS